MIKYEGVIFLKEPASKQSRDEFIARHINVYWLNRKTATRRKMLGTVYDLLTDAKSKY